MRITTKGRYALRAVHSLAQANSDTPVSIRELAEKEDISPEFLEQIFFRLKKTGMISSTRGPGGGFRLSWPPEKITLYDILEAVGEGVEFTPCLSNNTDEEPCERLNNCVAHEVWEEAADNIKTYFSNITLKSIMEKSEK